MINWDLLTPRNLFVIVLFALLALAIYKHFSSRSGGAPAAAAS